MRNSSLFAALLLASVPAFAQEPPPPAPPAQDQGPEIPWKEGPTTGDMGVSQITVPAGFAFADGEGAKLWAKITANPVSGNEIGLIGPDDGDWLVLFEYEATGYVKDDEKDDLKKDEILASIKEGTEAFNTERRKMGVPDLHVVGWEVEPHYNEAAHSLEWCVRSESNGAPSLNYNTRVLGRGGVASVTLMFGGETKLQDVMPKFRQLLAGFSYKPGQTYAEFKSGDKIAEYGLAALIAGGGVAVAAKAGLFAKFGKVLAKGGIFLLAAIGVALKKLFGGKSSPPPA
jgi:uncharacterized membrane-anchored protein